MNRRQLLAIVGTGIVTVTAGCSNSNSNQSESPSQDVSADVVFSVEDGDLVVTHESGDVLQQGQSLYVTLDGETVKEVTLDETIHAGGEIVRITDVNKEYTGDVIVGLYLEQQGESVEVDVGEVSPPLNQPAPAAQIDFDYTAAASDDALIINHDGGDTINADNTGTLGVNGASDNEEWDHANIASDGTVDGSVSAGQTIATVNATDLADSVELVWNSPDGGNSQVIGTWAKP